MMHGFFVVAVVSSLCLTGEGEVVHTLTDPFKVKPYVLPSKDWSTSTLPTSAVLQQAVHHDHTA